MPSIDIAMPTALLAVVAVTLLLNERVESKLKATFEDREFRTRDVILLVLMVAVVVSVIAYTSLLSPGRIFQNFLLTIFLFSYSTLLFTFTHIFSKMQKRKAQLLSLAFAVTSLIAGTVSFLDFLKDNWVFYRTTAFFGLAAFSLCAVLIAHKKPEEKERWYISVQPPALFLLLFIFYNLLYTGEIQVWDPILMDVYAITFAVLIILYLSSMFTWKTAVIFAVLLTIVDIILVLGTRTMVEAANQFTGIGLPVMVYLPNIPLIPVPPGYQFRSFFGFHDNGLGLGDFFFAGVIAIQTLKRFDKKTALISVVAMVTSFAIFLALMGEIVKLLEPLIGTGIGGFPGTLMIICGWLPIVAWKVIAEKNKNNKN
ncbi:MAG: hypothetical protein QXU99_04915 [Candidatus Bathyarchaeia archaeon]